MMSALWCHAGRSLPYLTAMALLAIIPPGRAGAATIKLPAAAVKGSFSLEEALAKRRTARSFGGAPLTESQLGQILWAAGGVTDPDGFKRSVPSAGALYPLEIYVAVGVPVSARLKAGIYRYLPREHALEAKAGGDDKRAAIAKAALNQDWIAQAPVVFLVAADYERTTGKYRERGIQYVHHEAGGAAQNIMLQAQALGLKAGIVGAFRDKEISGIFFLPESETPFLLLPVGH